ncbi:MAG: FAD-binding oxidoreductase [Prosthecobacter sp.]
MKHFRRSLKWAVLLVMALIALVAVRVAQVWWNDPTNPFPERKAGVQDAGGFTHGSPGQVIEVEKEVPAAEQQLSALALKCAAEGTKIAIAGAKHSMGGHTMADGGVVVDMLKLKGMRLNDAKDELTAGAGTRWFDVIEFLRPHGLAVAVMQSNSDFSIGGSLSVNCHGWQHNSAPISSTVKSLRVVTADGAVQVCSRTQNPELFRLVLGGYGLFGIITEATLGVVKDEVYVPRSRSVLPADYDRVFHEMTGGTQAGPGVGMAYGRINVAPFSFLESGTITVLERASPDAAIGTQPSAFMQRMKRLVFRCCVGSDVGKQFRWLAETSVGETAGGFLPGKTPAVWRNDIMLEPADLFGNRDPHRAEILHEYFMPVKKMNAFVEEIRGVLRKHDVDLMNITVRNVLPDDVTLLNYTRDTDTGTSTEVFGLVMLFHLLPDEASDKVMQTFTREMIDAALACGGTFYLPYRLHATPAQLRRAYPQAAEFFQLKRQHDPKGIFTNKFYETYGMPEGQ